MGGVVNLQIATAMTKGVISVKDASLPVGPC